MFGRQHQLQSSQIYRDPQHVDVVHAPATPQQQILREKKGCSCKNSQCLKLYCECFSRGEYCTNCHCANCKNNSENEVKRAETISNILDRNPDAFRAKITQSQQLKNAEKMLAEQ